MQNQGEQTGTFPEGRVGNAHPTGRDVTHRPRRIAMPLRDHFHPPLSEERHWEGFHSKWANVLVDELNQTLLPKVTLPNPTSTGGHVSRSMPPLFPASDPTRRRLTTGCPAPR